MRAVETLIVGAGQAGLAVSRCLTGHGADHVVVERGRIAERWRSARWDSLRLLTPNWMSRLPAWSYPGPDPDGYMAAPELAGYLEDYALVRGPGTREHDGRTGRGGRRRPARRHRPANLARAQRDRGHRDREPGLPAAGRQRNRPGDPPADRLPLPGTRPGPRRRRAGGRRVGVRRPDRGRTAPRGAAGGHLGGPPCPAAPPLPGPRHPVVDGTGRGPGPEHRSGARRADSPPGAVAAAIGPRPPGRPGGADSGRGQAGLARRRRRPAAALRR